MASFKEEIEKKKESQAYCMGLEAYRSGYTKKMVRSPFEENTTADIEWLDGFYDAWFMYMVTGGRNDE